MNRLMAGLLIVGVLCVGVPVVAPLIEGVAPWLHVVETGKPRVLFKTTRGDSAPLVLDGKEVNAWLDAHCSVADSGRPDWRRWPDNQKFDGTDEPKFWQEMFSDEAASAPCVIIAKGIRHWIYPLPSGPDADAQLMKILRKHGGE